MMGGEMIGGGMGFWMVFNMLFWLLIIAGIIVFVVWAVNKAAGFGRRQEEESVPDILDILKRRYAAGEISREEFEEKKKDLL